jgi:hypothetical protein
MMSETVLQTAVCDSCGAEVRDESLFCYNCGERVSQEIAVSEPLPEKPEVLVRPGSRPPLKSAASLRKQRRASNRQPVEVTWEQRTDSPAGFVIATIVLVVGALVLLVIALYLR